uniref:Uncharacterized protein n=1 Tax=Romanomermis culicivorax TaxID=13658 RepID=A0A915IXC6_ROMCU
MKHSAGTKSYSLCNTVFVSSVEKFIKSYTTHWDDNIDIFGRFAIFVVNVMTKNDECYFWHVMIGADKNLSITPSNNQRNRINAFFVP